MDNFAAILKRVTQKKEDYAMYGFEKLDMAAFNTFFDLAQELDGLKNLYLVSVAVPRIFFGIQSTLYMIDSKTGAITFEASSESGFGQEKPMIEPHIKNTDTPYQHGSSYVVPIHGKKTPASGLLFRGTGKTIGLLEVSRDKDFAEMERFFIQKYVNRIGYNLYNKALVEQNIQHLKFINNLVADIEHNVIIPNMRYKYFFKKIRRYLNSNKEIESELENLLEDMEAQQPGLYPRLSGIVETLVVINRSLFNDQEKIEHHYNNTSLFLESLFRRDHFLFGQYILDKQSCYLWKDIVLPQLQRYADRFLNRGITVNSDLHESEDFQVKVDKGLMAQVVANLFSNVIKYAQPVVDQSGTRVKKLACSAFLLDNFFGQGHPGARFHVFSSGPPIGEEDGQRVFDEGFRLTTKDSVEGTGHGLYFVKNVVEVHGGIVGHKSDPYGNQFYFVIPA
jgi:signal transduction histidine kinase